MAVSDQIIQVMDALCEKFGLMIDWTSENVIPYVTTLLDKIIQWEIWSSVAWIGIMTILTLITIVCIKQLAPVFKTKIEEEQYTCGVGWEFSSCMLIAVLCVFYLVAIITIGTQIMDIIKCLTFPEMIVFEYIQDLTNSGS